MNETIALHLRTEELNSINSDLRKQLNNAEHHKLQMNKKKIEVIPVSVICEFYERN